MNLDFMFYALAAIAVCAALPDYLFKIVLFVLVSYVVVELFTFNKKEMGRK